MHSFVCRVATAAEYSYTATGRRVTERYDMNQNNQLDSTEPTTVIATDLAGRRVATFITKGVFYAKETFFHHPPEISGPGFAGGPLVRDRNAALVDPDAWYDDADTDRLERRYYATDWQGRVVSMVTAAGELAESYRYTASGVPIGIPLGDVNGDGKVELGAADEDWQQAYWWENNYGPYDARLDLDLNGSVNAADIGLVGSQTPGTMPTARASAASVGNRMFASAMLASEAVLGREGDYRWFASSIGLIGLCSSLVQQFELEVDALSHPCVASSLSYVRCLDCCTESRSVDDPLGIRCAAACQRKRWDPRLDPDRNPPNWGFDVLDCRGNCWLFATCSPISPGWSNPWFNPLNLPRAVPPDCWSCDVLLSAVRSSGAIDVGPDGECPEFTYKIALMIKTGNRCDYHFYRQNPDDTWSDKPGCTPVRGPFRDPLRELHRRYLLENSYDRWCGYMCWPFERQIRPPVIPQFPPRPPRKWTTPRPTL